MFTIEQIHEAMGKVRSGADFPKYVEDLREIGVTHYDNFVFDGQTDYYGENNFVLKGEAKYPEMKVNDHSSSEDLKNALAIHQEGETDYPTFCKQSAEAGVEKWVTDIENRTVTYIDKAGNVLLVESIPNP